MISETLRTKINFTSSLIQNEVKYLLILLLAGCMIKPQTRTIIRIKTIFAEDSIYHPELLGPWNDCATWKIKDSIFKEIDLIGADSGYIYTNEPPQPLYFDNSKFFFAIDSNRVISNKIN